MMALHWDRFRDFALGHGVRWSRMARFMRTRISQAAAAIPLIGYALLWSQKLSEYLALQVSLGGGYFTITTRLLCLYFGAHFLAAAWVVYLWWCPRVIKRTPALEDYLFQEQQSHNSVEYSRICAIMEAKLQRAAEPPHASSWLSSTPITLSAEITGATVREALKNRNEPGRRGIILQCYFLFNEGRHFVALIAAHALVAAGLALLAIPSVEVFSLVLWQVLLPKLGLR